MKFIEKDKKQELIGVGDLVQFDRYTCLVVYEPWVSVDGDINDSKATYPFVFVDLNSGKIVNAYRDLDVVNKSGNLALLAKNKNIELHY